MKHTLFILALITASIQTFAQSPRIKLNQITKDSVTGSVLISSPTDSGMVYSRDLFISYGADTFLILGADTIVLQSDLIAEIGDSLVNYVSRTELSDSTTNIRTDIPLIIADSLLNYVNISRTQTITGAKTFSKGIIVNEDGNNFDTRFEGDTDANLLYLDASTNRVGIGTDSPGNQLEIDAKTGTDAGITIRMGTGNSGANNSFIGYENSGGTELFRTRLANSPARYAISSDISNDIITVMRAGNVGIGTTSPSEKLEVNGKVKISDLTGTGGNAVYENGGILGVASDARFKSHIADLDNGIDKILNLKPKYFIDNRNSAFQQLGFYAQEVKSVINEASYPIGNTEYLGINDRAIIAVTVKAIQEQQTIIETQSTEIETLKKLITDLSNRLQILENN